MTEVIGALEDLARDLFRGGDAPSPGRRRYIADSRATAVAALRATGNDEAATRVAEGKGGAEEAMRIVSMAWDLKRIPIPAPGGWPA